MFRMSSYYTTAQLEEMRKARLKQELVESIEKLKEQLRTEHANIVKVTAGFKIETSVFLMDDSVGGYSKSFEISGATLKNESDQNGDVRDVLDFSELLAATDKKPTKMEREIYSWVRRVDERPIISESDENDRTRLLAELNKIIQESATDIEDKLRSVKMRVSTYLQGAARMTDTDKEEIESTYYEYCALCEMLRIKPTEQLPYRVKSEVERMTSVLEKNKQDAYVMGVIESIMTDLGCHVKEDAVLERTVGQMFSVDGHPLCDVFVGNDGSGIMFEPIGESKDCSLERQRQIESSANSICSLYSVLEERAAEEGVILKRIYLEPSHIEEMCVQSDISGKNERKQQRKSTTQKQRVFDSEG